MRIADPVRVDPREIYFNRVRAVLSKLPRKYYDIIYDHYPQYNTPKGRKLVNNVVNLRSPDVTLTEILEAIANGELTFKKKAA